ncbi:hypothetical protein GeomeDRAFT_0123 [Geobacter metallireducens RCH3]|uniref:Lipoprotein n=1 Tax=Geobacter metallireducens (strain ATCC 53774 / DSM 7210 / GS-15) TaxID=269799 RepID=Q39VC9_GEOMG|nr:hypothetical protein [Geobacter metallireducens]ABB31795.1 hypothetical protein Gmet_1561 [Geobacter metallireducens GS-15]EHP89325.1 hypothetical protein GeomeDRAFT_0123 [Geobacter metallireducens RCH3]
MRRIAVVFGMFALSLVVFASFSAGAADKKAKSEVVMKVGNKVHLFHSGTADVKKEICPNDVITVYREIGGAKNPKSIEVGQVKVLSYVSAHYFEAEVVKGEVKPGDIAMKESAACLIQPVKH